MSLTILASPTQYSLNQNHDQENIIRQAWHSFEEALHLHEPRPPPVPPKDERWLVKTVNLAIPQEEPEPGFWDRLVQRIAAMHTHPIEHDDQDSQHDISINVPAEAALTQLGIQDQDQDMQHKKNYFKKMAVRCKEKFDDDNKYGSLPISLSTPSSSLSSQMSSASRGSSGDNDEDGPQDLQDQHPEHHHRRHRHHLRQYLHALHVQFHPVHGSQQNRQEQQQQEQIRFIPTVDPKEMKAAHRMIYHRGHKNTHNTDLNQEEDVNEDDDREDRKLFGPWWGWHRISSSKADKEIEKLLDSEWEKIEMPKSKEEKRQSLGEQNGTLATSTSHGVGSQSKWRRPPSFDAKSATTHDRDKAMGSLEYDRRAAAKRRQAIAAAAAYEAVKEYHARKLRQGKKVSHGEMKAALAGMAMAEALKLLESRHDHDDDENERDETVAEAGFSALKLFELMR
ncbi:hypothetical protein EDD11_009877 [Mortierella claussenii]|nr:hypothetical protein EDD11_009877 [Mortierella claussenii]